MWNKTRAYFLRWYHTLVAVVAEDLMGELEPTVRVIVNYANLRWKSLNFNHFLSYFMLIVHLASLFHYSKVSLVWFTILIVKFFLNLRLILLLKLLTGFLSCSLLCFLLSLIFGWLPLKLGSLIFKDNGKFYLERLGSVNVIIVLAGIHFL